MFLSRVLKNVISSKCFKMYSTETPNAAILVEKVGTITTIGINRPEKRNCVDFSTAELLKEAISNFENDAESTAGVLYGTGGSFCAGYDLTELSKLNTEDGNPLATQTGTMGPTQRFIKKPLIAAVSGYAVAGGFELALMCDMRIVEETAVMGVFCRRFGVPLIDGGTVRLQALIGLSRALDLILTGRAIYAKEACEWGLANRLVACGTGLGQAINIANSLTKFPQKCLNVDRFSTYQSAFGSKSLEENLEFERINGAQVILEESIPGAKKFVSGVGKHGKFYNLTEKPLKDWEIEDSKCILKK